MVSWKLHSAAKDANYCLIQQERRVECTCLCGVCICECVRLCVCVCVCVCVWIWQLDIYQLLCLLKTSIKSWCVSCIKLFVITTSFSMRDNWLFNYLLCFRRRKWAFWPVCWNKRDWWASKPPSKADEGNHALNRCCSTSSSPSAAVEPLFKTTLKSQAERGLGQRFLDMAL